MGIYSRGRGKLDVVCIIVWYVMGGFGGFFKYGILVMSKIILRIVVGIQGDGVEW